MNTVLDLGKVDYNRSGRKNCKVTIKMELENGRLSLCGNIWNPRETDIYSGGQCYETIAEYFPYNKRIKRLLEIWKRWHLNDMQAGSLKQMEWLRNNEVSYKAKQSASTHYVNWYDWATEELKNVGLNPDNGYTFGSAWLKEELPGDVVSELIKIFTPN